MKFGLLVFMSFGLALSNFIFAANNFNLEIEIPSQYRDVFAGEKVHFTTKIINLGGQQRMDIILEYRIAREDEEISFKRETVAIETQASFVGNIVIPDKTKPGNYVLQVQIIGEGDRTLSEGKVSFNVSERAGVVKFILKYKWQILLILAILVLIPVLYIKRKRFKDVFEKRKIKGQVSKIIEGKINAGKVTKEGLESSKLPNGKIVEIEEEEEFY